MKRVRAMLLVVLAVPSLALSLPWQTMQTVGRGEMRWLFFPLYEASLMTPSGDYRAGQRPLALSLRYHRNIAADDLVTATLKEWQRLEVSYPRAWVAQLQALWPDVQRGSRLTLYVTEQGHSRFYHNRMLLGEVVEPGFAPAFLSIWLSPKTREPRLRQRLLGIQ